MLQNPQDFGFLGKLGYTLQNTADPQYNERYMAQLAQQKQIEDLNKFRQGQLGVLEEETDMRRAAFEFERQQAQAKALAEQQRRQALGQLAAQGISPQAVQEYLAQGGDPSALGTLQSALTPKLREVYDPQRGGMVLVPESQALGRLASAPAAPKLREVYDPQAGAMVLVPETQALGRLASAPKERQIIEQDGVQYFADTGQPVIPNAKPSVKLTEGQKAADKAFAKEYVALQAVGGLADIDKQIGQLQGALDALKSGANVTGVAVAAQPDSLLALTNPTALTTRETVEEVVQRNLRTVLGAQFTEKEGERLIKRAFNPALSEAENAKRVERLINQMKSAAASKAAAIDYFEENGTLQGWKGKLPSMSDFDVTKDSAKSVSEMTDAELEAIVNGN